MNDQNYIPDFEARQVRFHARCCYRRRRTLEQALDQIHRSHGFRPIVTEVATEEWNKMDSQTTFHVASNVDLLDGLIEMYPEIDFRILSEKGRHDCIVCDYTKVKSAWGGRILSRPEFEELVAGAALTVSSKMLRGHQPTGERK